jgi:hypothetical protein
MFLPRYTSFPFESQESDVSFTGVQMEGWAHGHGVIMDQHYRVVKSVEPAGSYQASSDMHEFRLIADGRTALMTQYLRSAHDLCDYTPCDGFGYVHECAFQEVDVDTGEVLFQWRSLDHIGLDESYVLPHSTEISGTGESTTSPWDYFHINSIDKNQDGDYLISARHVSAVYKISGKDGHIMWRLNGMKSDFHLDGFGFSFQHDARWVSDGPDESVISLFNNGGNGYTQTHPNSDGKIIHLDHKTKVAKVLQKIQPPFIDGHAHYSKSQGNFQILPNGGIVAGWGNDPFWTEYAPGANEEREVVFYGYLATGYMMNYRAHKFDGWVGRPLTKPALWTYSLQGEDEMMFYVSWNGATEVKSWVLYGSREASDGPFVELAAIAKDGFETIYRHERGAFRWTYAEAIDKDGQVLGKSLPQEMYVPSKSLRPFCDGLACRFMPTDEEREREQEQEKGDPSSASPMGSPSQRATIVIVVGSILGAVLLILLAAVLGSKNRFSEPVHVFVAKYWRRFSLTKNGGSLDPNYRLLPGEEGETKLSALSRQTSR